MWKEDCLSPTDRKDETLQGMTHCKTKTFISLKTPFYRHHNYFFCLSFQLIKYVTRSLRYIKCQSPELSAIAGNVAQIKSVYPPRGLKTITTTIITPTCTSICTLEDETQYDVMDI
jgi:hypothetical protein